LDLKDGNRKSSYDSPRQKIPRQAYFLYPPQSEIDASVEHHKIQDINK
jgi:hypothetical protein